jgi:hypothetical protein
VDNSKWRGFGMGVGGAEIEREALGVISFQEEKMRDSGGSVGMSSWVQD